MRKILILLLLALITTPSYASRFNDVSITLQDSPSVDAFSRLRISDTKTIFDTKMNHSNEPEFWDDQEVSGSGTTSTHSASRASVTVGVSNTTAGKRVRQTFARPNYQPGKSQMVLMTGILGDGESGITREMGQFDDDNGLFFRNEDGSIYVALRTSTSGTPVDTAVVQSSWNLDTFDGTGTSGVTLDFTKTQIFIMDYQWLGVGRIRFGFDVDGLVMYAHEMLNANTLDVVYMSTPNNPLRYSIENDGTGTASIFETLCSAVISEGGQSATGTDYWVSTNGTHVDANTANTVYAVAGIRLKTGHKGEPVQIEEISLLSEAKANYEWILYKNPVMSTPLSYANMAIGPFQQASGATVNVITSGQAIGGGFGEGKTSKIGRIDNESGFGEAIDGTRDEFVLGVRPLSSNADIQGGIRVNVNH